MSKRTSSICTYLRCTILTNRRRHQNVSAISPNRTLSVGFAPCRGRVSLRLSCGSVAAQLRLSPSRRVCAPLRWGFAAAQLRLSIVSLATFALSAGYANAQNDPKTLTEGLGQVEQTLGGKGAITNKDLFEIAINGVNFGLSLVAVIALLAIVGGAIYYIISLGNDEKVQRAKKIVLYSILGVMVAGISFVIIETIKQVIQ